MTRSRAQALIAIATSPNTIGRSAEWNPREASPSRLQNKPGTFLYGDKARLFIGPTGRIVQRTTRYVSGVRKGAGVSVEGNPASTDRRGRRKYRIHSMGVIPLFTK